MADEEISEIPTPLPEVPRGKLWSSLAIPPVVTIIGSVIAGSLALQDSSGVGNLYVLPLFVLPVGLVAIIIALVLFVRTWRVRHHGWPLVLTGFGFSFGQTILCLVLWFGCCNPWITEVHSRL